MTHGHPDHPTMALRVWPRGAWWHIALVAVSQVCAVALGVILLAFALDKAQAPARTTLAIERVLAATLAPGATWTLIALEIAVGSFLLAGWRTRWFLATATILGAGFVGWSAWGLLMQPEASCGCGASKVLSFGLTGARGSLMRAAIFFAIGFLGLVASTRARLSQMGTGTRRSV